MSQRLHDDAIEISRRWLSELDVAQLIAHQLGTDEARWPVDVVAIGKAAREMAAGARRALGERVGRELVVIGADDAREPLDELGPGVVVGEHPIPGRGSLAAGVRLLDFLDRASDAHETLFLISGGASSLCVVPAPPLDLEHLTQIWRAALASGLDITVLNQVRASTSLIGGGAVLGRVKTPRSRALIMVDNVISGAPWVASALTYDFRPTRAEMDAFISALDVTGSELALRMGEAFTARSEVMDHIEPHDHVNVVLVEPRLVLDRTVAEATLRGYRVISLGDEIHGDVETVVREWGEVLHAQPPGPTCVVGVGEVTVRVGSHGRGGRCQEFAWRMAGELATLGRAGVFVARSSDGRDYIAGVAGAWVDESSRTRAEGLGIDWEETAREHDTYEGLRAIGQLLEGWHTGWNLCDLYLAVLD